MVIRPIAFRPSPARPGSSTGPPVGSGSRPPSSTFTSPGRGPGSTAPSPGLSSTGYRTPVQTTFGPGGSVVTGPGSGQAPHSQGFLPGHPLVKDGQRPFGSKYPEVSQVASNKTCDKIQNLDSFVIVKYKDPT